MAAAQAIGRRVSRGEVHMVQLDPTRGSEIRKTRPCVVVSPDEMNHHIRTVIIAPLTSGGRPYPTRVPCTFQRVRGFVVLDQLGTVDQERLVRRIGILRGETLARVFEILREMFAD